MKSEKETVPVPVKYETDNPLTSKIKDFAMRELNADLVGIANIERFVNAPIKMSPHGLMPTGKSVIVMAVHHPDAIIELDGQKHPQGYKPYAIQGHMNSRLDEMSYRMALYLEDLGYNAIPISGSNIWRYKGYKELNEHFAPDISHMHSAVAAGLAEFGYNGLALTPEFGARQRYVTIVTDAKLIPSPLIEPGSVCDNCKLCVKHCLSGALSKEIDGWNIVKIEDKEYKYAKKNLWRCAWAEHFALDLDLKIPEKVDEDVIIEMVKKHGLRGGEMGSCLRHCLPKNQRKFDKSYSSAPIRKKPVTPISEELGRGIFEKIRSTAAKWGIDTLFVNNEATLKELNINLSENGYMPTAKCAISLVTAKKKSSADADYEEKTLKRSGSYFAEFSNICGQASYDIIRILEASGFNGLILSNLPEETFANALKKQKKGILYRSFTILTDAELPLTENLLPEFSHPLKSNKKSKTSVLKKFLAKIGADMVGISPASRIEKASDALAKQIPPQKILVAVNKAKIFHSPEPEVTEKTVRILSPEDHLKGAKSVLVIGLRLPRQTVDITARTPAEAVGPYAFASYQSGRLLSMMAWRATRLLEEMGHSAAWTMDITGIGSFSGNPRGEVPDIFCNSIAAAAAGLGRISKGGFAVTPEYGANMRFVAIVTDADLESDETLKDASVISECEKCNRCIKACPANAFSKNIKVPIDGIVEEFTQINHQRCDWAKRYTLVASEGSKYQGWDIDIPVPEKITAKNLSDAIRQHPVIKRHLQCNFEQCALSCPYSRPQ
ncbi:MAG: hypothetical protein A2017_21095 [Lentisphaerae bacterium GWF2_44_16]|nr:MAG: hypothetical protein A2017_21095 [Lentisphaerae bacterium GWF2_44_16]